MADQQHDAVLVDMHDPDNEMRGKEAYGAYLTEAFRHLDDISSTTVSFTAEGDRIAAETEVRATFRADPDAQDGAEVVLHYCLIEVIRDGQVQSERVYSDSGELTRQL